MISGKKCWLFDVFRTGGGAFCLEVGWMRGYMVIEVLG